MSKKNYIKGYNDFINESFTEFNLQRFSMDSSPMAIHVDNPQLSTDAFDKHQDIVRQSVSRINNIMFNIKGNTNYNKLLSELTLEDQDIQSVRILRILKENNTRYNVYLTFKIKDKEYWGRIIDILSEKPIFESEVFMDSELIQTKEWVIKTRGVIIKTIKEWLRPVPGMYKQLQDEVICFSINTGEQLVLKKNMVIELVRSHGDMIMIYYDGVDYKLVGDNQVYFNWWYEKIDSEYEG